ncbi:MAG TPA: T9SS type A sorting domain-containing protein [Bacteroidia bacterium]|nr:T9SS type A sorting domain-containing protein [Bacteroidia bacterium]
MKNPAFSKSFLVKPILVIAFLVLIKCNCFAAVKTAAMDGYWSNPNIWLPAGVPASNDSVTIIANVYFDIPVTITAGGRVVINIGATLCGQDTFRLLCGGFLLVNGLMSGIDIYVSDGVIGFPGHVYAEHSLVSNPCSSGFIVNGLSVVGQPYSCPTTGIDEISDHSGVNVFPNPFSGYIEISLAGNELTEIILYDLVSRKRVQKIFRNNVSLNTAALAKGIYFYEVRKNNAVIKKGKVIKE